jgi:hypothetical protein
MDFNFDNALNGLCDTIPTFNFSNFASKDFVPPKAQILKYTRFDLNETLKILYVI